MTITAKQLVDQPDIVKTLRLLVDGKITNPTDLSTQAKINNRYARELMGLLVAHQLAQVVEHVDELSWEPTEAGHRLAEEVARMIEWNRKGEGPRTTGQRGQDMARNTGAKSAKKAAPKAAKEKVPCACGCGQTTGRQFAQGHDAKMVSEAAKAVTGVGEVATKRAAIAKQFSEALASKFESAATNRLTKSDAKAAAAKARAEASAAKAKAKAAKAAKATKATPAKAASAKAVPAKATTRKPRGAARKSAASEAKASG